MVYILRGKGMGEESMPAVASLLGIPCRTSDDAPHDDLVFRWGCTALNLGQSKIVNKSTAIQEVSDKKTFRGKLAKAGLAPKFWENLEEYILDGSYKTLGCNPSNGSESLVESVLLRPAHHQRSQGLFPCTDLSEVVKAIREINGPYYISELIQKTREFRVFVCSNRIAFMIEKTPKDSTEVSWGCVSTGDFKYVDWSDWPELISQHALDSMKMSSLDFGAVDIIVKGVGVTYALEINTAPHLSPYYQKCVAKCFRHIIQNGRDHFPEPENYSWKSVIHPAIMKDL